MEDDLDADIKAISTLISVLRPLDDNARIHVLEFVTKKLGIAIPTAPTPSASEHYVPELESSPKPELNSLPSNPATIDIRSFAHEKSPRTVNEKVALVAYYIAHLASPNERRDYISSDDIKPFFIQAGFQLPTAQPNVTLSNAKNAGYLVALERGQFKLNAVGHNLVAHKLPSDGTKDTGRKNSRPRAKSKPAPKSRRKK